MLRLRDAAWLSFLYLRVLLLSEISNQLPQDIFSGIAKYLYITTSWVLVLCRLLPNANL